MKRLFSFGIVVCMMMVLSPAAAPCAEPPRARNTAQQMVFWLDEHYNPKVNLKTENLSVGLQAILAYYAMRASTGCIDSPDGDGRVCSLTTALGLGRQCSTQQLKLVSQWFRTALPPINLSRKSIDNAITSRDLKGICNDVPDTATHRSMWEIIRVAESEGLVTVYAMGSWTAGPGSESGSFRYETVYRIKKDSIDLVRHTELPVRSRGR